MNKLTQADISLMKKLNGNVSHYDFHADEVPMVQVAPDKLRLGKIPGNPAFTAQFDTQLLIKYFTVAGGAYTLVAAAAIAATLKTQLPAFVFGNSDFAGGFKKSQGQFPLAGGWAYDVPFVYGRDYATTVFGVLDATAKAQLQIGDLVIPFWATTAGPVDTVGFVIIRCAQVAYGTLLESLTSDLFWLNNIRYILTDTSAQGLTQYNNNIFIQDQSLFGKFKSDNVSPNSFKQPEQFQSGIVDIPINKGIDKNVMLGSYLNYDSVTQQWSIFVKQVDKLAA